MIKEFEGEYSFLSNFWPSPVKFGDLEFPTVEHAFHAAKTLIPQERLVVMNASSPGEAKAAGRKVTLRPDWERVKVAVMRSLVAKKFENPELRAKLIATGDQPLEEGNNWNDLVWGVDISTGAGANLLGKILMDVRADLK